MLKRILLISGLLAIIILATGCGISQSEYDKVVAENHALQEIVLSKNESLTSANKTITELNKQIANMVNPPKYFENRTSIENWLNLTPKLGVSKDVEQWYQFALYYQQKALKAGYYLSVSYNIKGKEINVTCDVITIDGYLFFFNPDDCKLIDSGLTIDIKDIADLEKLHPEY